MVKQTYYGTLANGEIVTQYTLTNQQGTEVNVISYGGIITSFRAIDNQGKLGDIVLGYDKLDDYLTDVNFFGALIGRFGNRIAQGKFELEGKSYQVELNNGENHLHGGYNGYDKKNWSVTPYVKDGQQGLKLQLLSEDGDQGYPGNVFVQVDYLLTQENELVIQYQAITDQATLINLTQHTYFNLAGQGKILSHELMIDAEQITEVDSGLIPTGKLIDVADTPFDFKRLTPIGQHIEDSNTQLKYGLGFDHNYVLNKKSTIDFALAAKVVEPTTGRVLEVFTTEPGIQFYSGNFLDGQSKGKGQSYQQRSGFCLEPQHFPDSPNKAHFPSTVLKPGQKYNSKMIYKLSTIN
ncbi:aldose epimerase family protein [Catenovulum maritimum]|uniref:Aldose 1-epimerase n=1 Tax=Catenovulum maritimum TaxID=1513271 RepID=A0A0J8GU86_9ALTE|nr:aldose epimerase family protein [Catenovulum maritimum]KMT64248.1 aldose epimerase [Catenovulum maritimum]